MPGSDSDAIPRSIAITTDRQRWLLLNVSSDAAHDTRLRAAAEAGEIAGVVLLDGRHEHTAGLAALCGDRPVDVFTTPGVFEGLAEAAPTLGLLDGRCTLRWHLLPISGDVRSADFRIAALPALQCRALAADDLSSFGERIVLEIDDTDTGQCLYYAGGQRPCWVEDDTPRLGAGA